MAEAVDENKAKADAWSAEELPQKQTELSHGRQGRQECPTSQRPVQSDQQLTKWMQRLSRNLLQSTEFKTLNAAFWRFPLYKEAAKADKAPCDEPVKQGVILG